MPDRIVSRQWQHGGRGSRFRHHRLGGGLELPALGAAYRDTGRLSDAVDCLQRSRLISRDIGDRWSEAMAIHNLGDTYRHLGEHLLAIDLLDQAVVIRRAIGDRYGEAWTLHDLGAAYRDQRQLPDASAASNSLSASGPTSATGTGKPARSGSSAWPTTWPVAARRPGTAGAEP